MKKKRLLIATLILVAIGLVMVYSSSHIWAEAKFNDSFYYIKRQALFAVVGLVRIFCAFIIIKNLTKISKKCERNGVL